MADVAGGGYALPFFGGSTIGGFNGVAFTLGGGPIIVTYYKMRAQEYGVPPPGYVTWVVQDDPDFAGVGYYGGTPTPFNPPIPGSIIVAAVWQE